MNGRGKAACETVRFFLVDGSLRHPTLLWREGGESRTNLGEAEFSILNPRIPCVKSPQLTLTGAMFLCCASNIDEVARCVLNTCALRVAGIAVYAARPCECAAMESRTLTAI